MVRVAEDEWVISDERHDSIIKEDIFNQVQNILYNRNVKVNKKGEFHKYSGFVKCPDCGANLYRITKIQHKKEKVFYYCSTYIRTKKCKKHYIQETELDEIILKILNNYIELISDVGKKIDDIISFSQVEYNDELKKIRIKEMEKELEKYQSLLNELMKDYKCDFISQEDYDDFKQKYLYEINKLYIEKENLKISKMNSYNLVWIEKFRKTGRIEAIDRNIVDSFIENIYVDDNKNIEIEFRFKNQYKFTLEYLKNQKNMI